MGEGGSLALEDGLVLADLLAAGDGPEDVLGTFEERRRPRVEWVQEQSRIAERAFLLPPQSRNAALRERGDEMLRARYRPLIPEP
jgi:2-polyprenyl-6-methoxyphenol hydroxylase-like FAD-dependent oxidoreductase